MPLISALLPFITNLTTATPMTMSSNSTSITATAPNTMSTYITSATTATPMTTKM
jgi:hypothetical protein